MILVQALEHLPREYNLVCLGDGPERARLIEYAESNGLTDRVQFPGFVSDVKPFLAAADIFVHPSVSETFCLSAYEAAECRLPVVAFDNSGAVSEAIGLELFGVKVMERTPEALANGIRRARGLIGCNESFARMEQVRDERLAHVGIVQAWHDIIESVGSNAPPRP
jgi:glycosyltransferase involved in cell wall biosynthesis